MVLRLSLMVVTLAVVVISGSRAAHAQLPGLPDVNAINASAQIGTVWPTPYSTVPSTELDELGLWGWGVETEFFLPIADDSPWQGTLGLGFNYLNLSADVGAGRRLRGGLRDLPTLSLYFGRVTNAWYVGVSLGLSELKDGRLHRDPPPGQVDPGPITVSATALSPGLSVGYELGPAFVEVGYVGRYFPSLAYGAIPTSGFPADLGERMYAGGFVVRVGGTFTVKEPK